MFVDRKFKFGVSSAQRGRNPAWSSPASPNPSLPYARNAPQLHRRNGMTLPEIKGALWRAYTDISRNHSLQMAAALSYYFVLSLFPALIFLSAIVAYLPVPDLFNQSLL